MVTSHIVMLLIQDMFHIIPAQLLRRLRIPSKPLSNETLQLQAWLMIAAILSTIATLVPLTFITRTQEAKVVAVLAGMELPDSFIQQQEMMLGVSRVYWNTSYSASF
jgi:hypothetical protein